MKQLLLILLIFFSFSPVFGQEPLRSEETYKEFATQANMKKSANSKDILSTFLRASIDNLLGEDRQFTLNSTLFAWDSILSRGHARSYEVERALRQTTIDIKILGDSSNSITQFGVGVTYAVVNKKDIRYRRLDKEDRQALSDMVAFMSTLHQQIVHGVVSGHAIRYRDSLRAVGVSADSIEKKVDAYARRIDTIIQASWHHADSNNDFSDLHPYIIKAMKDSTIQQLIVNSTGNSPQKIRERIAHLLTGEDIFHTTYLQMAERHARGLLWTISPAVTYDRVHQQGEYSFGTSLTFGLGKDLTKKPWEFEARGIFRILNDSSVHKTNYSNQPMSVSVGINKVLMENEDKESKMEFKFFTQLDYQFGDAVPPEGKSVFSLNSTLRVNLYKSIWLPVTIKYDPDNGNFFGFFSVTANIGN